MVIVVELLLVMTAAASFAVGDTTGTVILLLFAVWLRLLTSTLEIVNALTKTKTRPQVETRSRPQEEGGDDRVSRG